MPARLWTIGCVLCVLAGPAAAAAAPPPAPGGATPGWNGGPAGGDAGDLTPVAFDSATTARYRATAARLAAAVASDDAAAFRALHTDAGWGQADDWWQAMLATQKKKFGRIVRAVGPLRGSIPMGRTGLGLPRDGAAILLLFEKPLGASMSFTLDPDGKIVTSSLWIQRELASAELGEAEVLWPPAKGSR